MNETMDPLDHVYNKVKSLSYDTAYTEWGNAFNAGIDAALRVIDKLRMAPVRAHANSSECRDESCSLKHE